MTQDTHLRCLPYAHKAARKALKPRLFRFVLKANALVSTVSKLKEKKALFDSMKPEYKREVEPFAYELYRRIKTHDRFSDAMRAFDKTCTLPGDYKNDNNSLFLNWMLFKVASSSNFTHLERISEYVLNS